MKKIQWKCDRCSREEVFNLAPKAIDPSPMEIVGCYHFCDHCFSIVMGILFDEISKFKLECQKAEK
jgi:hypothetical protein